MKQNGSKIRLLIVLMLAAVLRAVRSPNIRRIRRRRRRLPISRKTTPTMKARYVALKLSLLLLCRLQRFIAI